MIILILLCLIISSSVAAPVQEDQAQIVKSVDTNDGKGNYEFSFETSNGIRRQESGTLINEGQPDEHIEVYGFYSYIDTDGKLVEIRYIADENGYQILPILKPVIVSAPVPAAVVATLLGG